MALMESMPSQQPSVLLYGMSNNGVPSGGERVVVSIAYGTGRSLHLGCLEMTIADFAWGSIVG